MLSLANHLACAHIWPDSGPFLVGACIAQPSQIPEPRYLRGWQDILQADIASLLWPLPETEDLLCACAGMGNPLDHKNEEMVSLSSTQSGPRAPAGVLSQSVIRRPVVLPGAHLSPTSKSLPISPKGQRKDQKELRPQKRGCPERPVASCGLMDAACSSPSSSSSIAPL